MEGKIMGTCYGVLVKKIKGKCGMFVGGGYYVCYREKDREIETERVNVEIYWFQCKLLLLLVVKNG